MRVTTRCRLASLLVFRRSEVESLVVGFVGFRGSLGLGQQVME